MSGVSGVDQILGQIRAMRQMTSTPGVGGAEGLPAPQGLQAPAQAPAADSFGGMLKASVQAVNQTQQQAGTMATAWERGDSEVSLTQVMVSLQKADVSFKAMMEVRNKMVDAYQEIMRMSV
ncbi:MAG: flagellar hook-basal body complex protein FliE [Perlucidibaca sp.]